MTLSAALLSGCDNQADNSIAGPISSRTQHSGETTDGASQQNLTFLSFPGTGETLNKMLTVTEMITVEDGGELALNYSPEGGQFHFAFGCNNVAPYEIYRLKPSGADVVGRLQFRATAIAFDPENGLLYYLSAQKEHGLYKMAFWNVTDGTHQLLPGGSSFRPGSKLAFGPDGKLYGVKYNDPTRLYSADPQTGNWSFVRSYDSTLGQDGGLALGPDGQMYNANSITGNLEIIDLNSSQVETVGFISDNTITGLTFIANGDLYATTYSGWIAKIDRHTAAILSVWSCDIDKLMDVSGEPAELSYLSISLEFMPGSLDNDEEMTLEISSNEIVGGVAVTFGPHGRLFNIPAILNARLPHFSRYALAHG